MTMLSVTIKQVPLAFLQERSRPAALPLHDGQPGQRVLAQFSLPVQPLKRRVDCFDELGVQRPGDRSSVPAGDL